MSLQSIRDFLLSPTIIGLIAWIGLAAGYIYHRKSKPRGRMSFIRNTVTLTSGRGQLPKNVEILYQGKAVPHVAQTSVIVWNSGNTIIDRHAFVERDPLRLSFGKNVTVLQANVLESTRDVIQFAVDVPEGSQGEVRLGFDFLEPGDGARVAVLHTGDNVQPRGLGTLKGVRHGLQDSGNFDLSDTVTRTPLNIALVTAFIGLFVAGAAYLIFTGAFPNAALALFPSLGEPGSPEIVAGKISWLKILGSAIPLAMAYFIYMLERRTFPKRFIAPRERPTKAKE